MKQEIATKLAATEVEGLAVDKAAKVVGAFLGHLSSCAVCDGEPFLTGRELSVQTGYSTENVVIDAGTAMPCPKCGGDGGDPDFVMWVCRQGDSRRQCEADRAGEAARSARHADCGLHVCLPNIGTAR